MPRILAFSTLLIVSLVFVAFPQTNTGTITGVLKDPSGAVVAGAKLHMQDTTTGLEVVVTTDGSGEYTSPPLRPDPYTVKVEAQGFRSEVSTLNLEISQRAVLNFNLQVGATSETVTVEAVAPLLEVSRRRWVASKMRKPLKISRLTLEILTN